MFLQKLSLQDFRSYQSQDFTFRKSLTIFLGPNAVGKTNILESLVLLSVAKSFRLKKDEEMIAWGKELGRAKAFLENEESVEIILTHGQVQGKKVVKKKFLVNGVAKRKQDFVGQLKTVLFEPQDLLLIVGNPSKRRDYLDFVLAQSDWQYNRCLLVYKKGLRQRNKLLDLIRDKKAQETQLEFWNRTFVKNGEILQAKRQEFLEFLNHFVGQKKLPISPIFVYDKSLISSQRLEQYHLAEIALGNTLVGPHRDDIFINFKNENGETLSLADFGSRGQQRLVILAMKMAELDFIFQKTSQKPVLLLDDIFSELDPEHQRDVLQIVNNYQTIITATEIAFLDQKLIKDFEIINL
ncbi:DNA replication and repair protein RecF [Candidatus Beckwithbacteria bacterium]|nr:DNA replication and repair protein RecF [Candidatus Beckwithbacteria bacterium]